MRFTTSLVALALVGTASTLDAQACLGIASFATGPMRVDGTFSTGNDQNTLGAGLSFGAPRGPFISAQVNRTDIEDTDESATGFGLQGGFELNLQGASSTPSRWSVCPVASFNYAKTSIEVPGSGEDVDFSANSLAAGISLGTTVAGGTGMTLAPFGTASIVRQAVKFEGLGVEEDDSETGAAIDLGVGFIFSQRFTVRPVVTIPVGFEGADPQFGVSVHFNFGSRR